MLKKEKMVKYKTPFKPNKTMDNSHSLIWEKFLTLSLEHCLKEVKAHRGSIFIFDEEKKELILEIAKNFKNNSFKNIRKTLGEGIVGKVALLRKPLLVKDVDKEIPFQDRPFFFNYHSKSFLSLPLEYSENLVGVLNLTEKEDGVFDDQDLNTVLEICKNLGIAMYALKNYLKKQKEDKERLLKEIENLKKVIDHSQKFSSLGKLVGGFIHEINNPLDGIIRYINLSLDCLEEESIVKEYLFEAKQGLNRIARFIRSLLDFCWSLSSSQNSIDINRALEESLFLFNYYFHRYRIEVLFISTQIEGGRIKIVFKDTGCGIPEEIKEKIFEPFFTTKKIGEGSGLGLAISYEIIQRYQGKIFVESEKNQGATFVIELPLEGNRLQ
ncbi:MAG: hypothetical protein B6D55_02855 [Candidatus Omnitrophica bacterium 4484_70.2]|nr:MAG: hypothetical protein B6D55_02855 [Candidatus Omnitrophica bacterium 4484_70.2]